jgi:hypothetical protein
LRAISIFFAIVAGRFAAIVNIGAFMNFASDNTAGVAPEILKAMVSANDGSALPYGNDELTRGVEGRFCDIFGHDVAVFMVPTGTAANALALAHVSPPWGAVFSHAEAHIMTDECGAPEFFGSGLKLVGLPGVGCKVEPNTLTDGWPAIPDTSRTRCCRGPYRCRRRQKQERSTGRTRSQLSLKWRMNAG